MAQTKLRAAPRQRATLGNSKANEASVPEYNLSLHHRQADIDLVGILAARSGVHPATVAAHLAAFGIGGAHG